MEVKWWNGAIGEVLLGGMGPSIKYVWGMAGYDLTGKEDGDFSSFKFGIAIAKLKYQQHPDTGDAQNDTAFGWKCVLTSIFSSPRYTSPK